MLDKVMCPHCQAFSSDTEFCDNCGRAISSLDIENTYSVENKTKWKKNTLPCVTIEGNLDEKTVKSIMCCKKNENIQIPCKIQKQDNKNILYFVDNGEENLESLIKDSKIDLEKSNELIIKIGNILKELQNENYVLGSLDLSSFWVENNDVNQIILRQINPLIYNGDIPKDYVVNKISAPEVVNNQDSKVDFSADVFLLGKLYSILILNGYPLKDYAQERYMLNQLRLFNPKIQFELHSWIGKILNIYPEDRFLNIEDALNELYMLIERSNKRKELIYCEELEKADIKVTHKEITHVGEGKKELVSQYKDIIKLNEDSFLFLQDKKATKVLALVADGISTCKYGSGYEAANITKDIAKKLWEDRKDNINTQEDVEKFFNDLVDNVNCTIVKKVMSSLKFEDKNHINSSDIMGTTLVATIILKNILYYISIGDSKIYLWNKESKTMLLNYDDNAGNEYLKDMGDWYEYDNMEEKSSLVNFLGGADTSCWPFKVRNTTIKVNKCNLFDDETIILCSDGLTDYLNPIGHRNDEWNKDMVLDKLIRNNIDEGLDKVCEKFVEEANNNGGGDNITVVTINLKFENSK